MHIGTRTKVALRVRFACLFGALLVLGACQRGCGKGVGGNAGAPRGSPTADHFARTDDVTVGQPAAFGNLTVFPILRQRQPELGKFTSLDTAVRANQAEIRELGPDSQGQGPRVNQLVIENRGDVPIYVLAGTIVKGGNQDRQIGQDFLAAAHTTTPVDAFCVEHGRWSATRRGSDTGGRFVPIGQLATKDVRAAAQYHKNQAQVWSMVGALNATNQKHEPTGTLLATLEDEGVERQREELEKKVGRFLDAVRPETSVVGLAYAVNGKVESVRWFAQHALFELFEKTLLAAAANDAITNRSGPSTDTPVTGEAVKRFMAELDRAPEQETRAATRQNTNSYSAAEPGYRAKTMLQTPAQMSSPISVDYASR